MMPVGTLEQVSPRGRRSWLKNGLFGVMVSGVPQALLLARSRARPWKWTGGMQYRERSQIQAQQGTERPAFLMVHLWHNYQDDERRWRGCGRP